VGSQNNTLGNYHFSLKTIIACFSYNNRVADRFRLEGTAGGLWATLCSKKGEVEQVVQAVTTQVFNASKDEDSTSSLSNLLQSLTTLTVKNIFLILSISVCASCSVTSSQWGHLVVVCIWEEYLEISAVAKPPAKLHFSCTKDHSKHHSLSITGVSNQI